MYSDFYKKYQDLSKEKLFQIGTSADYQPEAIAAAKHIIKEKNWSSDFEKVLAAVRAKEEESQREYEEDIIEKAAYYKNAVEYKNQNNSFEIRIGDIPKFEGALNGNNIEYFREDKNIGLQLDSYPTQSYYFKNEDVEEVDKIVRGLGIITAPYLDAKPFFRFEIKVALIVLIVSIILFWWFRG